MTEPSSAELRISLPRSGEPERGDQCGGACGACAAPVATRTPDAGWLRAARWARCLAWASLVWMATEGGIGLWQGFATGSIALTGWALGSTVEGLASVIVVWRFTGARTLSTTAERCAQRGVAISFWLLSPYIAAESVRDLLTAHHTEPTVIGIALTAAALLAMPLLGYTKHRLGIRLGSAATTGEGTQNYLCAAQAAAVLLGLVITSAWAGGWWLDPAIGLLIAAVSVWEGRRAWCGENCC